MNIFQLLHTCLRSILRNRMRSLLTSLGVIIGVGSVIIMVALGEGSQRAIEARITAMGTNLLQVIPRRQMSRSGQQTIMRMNSFTKNDIQKLREESTFASAISGVVQTNSNVTGSQGNALVSVQGVEPDFFIARNWSLSGGYFFDEQDMALRSRVAVIGTTTARNLFTEIEAALGQQIRIGTNYFTVIGILESKGAGFSGNDQDDIVMIPMDTAITRLTNSRSIGQIVISVINKEYMEAAQKEAELILRESRNIAVTANADFDIMNQADMIDMASATSRTLTTLLAAIAGVSLLVGGIGIMNIMFVSVTERTREIGLRMAVGAKDKDILRQFLIEAIMISLTGGVIGMIFGVGASFALNKTLGWAISVEPMSIVISFAVCVATGMFFGWYPAFKASKLDPIEALRFE